MSTTSTGHVIPSSAGWCAASSLAWKSSRTERARAAHEVGCGEGELAMRLARRGLRVRGTDVSPGVIEEARRRAGAAGLQIEFRASPVQDLALERDAAELIVCCEVLEHM